MNVEHMNYQTSQIGSLSALEHMIALGDLNGNLKAFLLSCKVDELSPATIKDYEQKIGAFVRHCSEINISRPGDVNVSHVRMFLLKLQEHIRDMLLLCDESKFLGVRNRAIILAFVDTGLRLSELAGIQLKEIDFDRELIKVMGKGAKERVVGIGKVAQKAMLKYLLIRRDNHPCLWVTEEGRPMQARGIQIMIRRLGKRIGIDTVRCSPLCLMAPASGKSSSSWDTARIE